MSENTTSGRIPFEVVDLENDNCQKLYGVSCGAVLGQTGENKCFNTRKTCQAIADYAAAITTKYLTFGSMQVDSLSDEYVIPSLVNVSISPAKLNPAGGGALSALGQRSTITVSFQDHAHSDLNVDPYVAGRISGTAQSSGIGYNPLERGTFWGKWRARNEYINNREIRYRSGYIVDGQLVDEETQVFYATSFAGPDSSGKVSINGIDPIGLIRNDKAQCPARSAGSLLSAINDTDLAATLTPAGVGATYPASGMIRIGEELILFNRTGDALTFTGRAQQSTAAEAHDAGALVQRVERYLADTVSDIIYDLLTVWGSIPAALIDKAAWDAEIAEYNPRSYTAYLTEPEGVAALVSELCEQAGVYLWYDGRDNTIRLRTVRAPSNEVITELSDETNIIADSFQPTDDTKHFTTQVWVSFAQRNPTKKKDEASNYAASEVAVDLSVESDDQARGSVVRQIYSRWIPAAGAATALDIAERVLARYKRPIKVASMQVDAKDRDIDLGDFVLIRHRQLQDEVGEKAPTQFQVIERTEAVTGTTLKLTVQEAAASAFVDSGETLIIIAADMVNLNLRTLYDEQLPGSPPQSGDVIRFIIRPNVIIGGYACGIYTDGIVSVAEVGRGERRGLYLGEVQTVSFRRSVSGMWSVGEVLNVVENYMPALQRQSSTLAALTARGNTVFQFGNRAYINSAALMCDLRTVPTVPSVETGSWPAGVTLRLEVQPGARIQGEGGAGSVQYGAPDGVTLGASYATASQIFAAWAGRVQWGGDGGDAIQADYALEIINNGEIYAGAGGGAGVCGINTAINPATGIPSYAYASAEPWSRCGAGGRGFYGGESGSNRPFPQAAGAAGRRGSAGAAGTSAAQTWTWGFGSNQISYTFRPGSGGGISGGLTGMNVLAGVDNSILNALTGLPITADKTSGGLPGRLVVNSGNVTWTTRGVVAGDEVA